MTVDRWVPPENGVANFYPSIRRYLTFSRYFLCAPYEIDAQKKLRVNRLNLAIYFFYRGYDFYERCLLVMNLLPKVLSADPYLILYAIHRGADSLYWTVIEIEIVRRISKVKEVFKRFRVIYEEIRLRKSLEEEFSKATNAGMLSSVWLPLFSILYNALTVTQMSSFRFFLLSLTIAFNQALAVLPIVLLQLIVTLCTYYIKFINSELREIKQRKNFKGVHVIDKFSGGNSEGRCGEDVRNLRRLMGKIDGLKDELTEAFGAIVYCNFLYLSSQIIFLIFLSMTIALHSEKYTYSEALFALSTIVVSIAFRSLTFFKLVKKCSSLAEEGQIVSEIVHELLAEHVDISIRRELTIFSAVLLNRRNEMIVNRTLNLGNTLMTSVFSIVMMGVTVLVQFDFGSQEKDFDPANVLLHGA